MLEEFLKTSFSYQLTVGLYLAALLSYIVSVFNRTTAVRLLTTSVMLLAFGLNTYLIIDRWFEAGRAPFKTLFESLVLFTWCTAFIYLIVERFARLPIMGVLTNIFIIACFAYATTKVDIEIVNLPAALQSPWFIPHVVVYFLGYAGLFIAFVAALISLVKPSQTLVLRNVQGDERISYIALMHKSVVFGFILLTAGLLMGAFWAKTAWGDYWVWDPKENWSLISWLVFAIYFHLRRIPDWKGRRSAWVCVVGFAAVIFTYLGMSLLPTVEQSAHVYQ